MVLHCQGDRIEWYKQTAGEPERLQIIHSDEVEGFLHQHERDFSPTAIYEAKTRARLPGHEQLSFVDIGLLPAVEETLGNDLAKLVARTVGIMEDTLRKRGVRNPPARDIFKSVFWLLAAKILRDKRVAHFNTLTPDNAADIFRKVGLHYSEANLEPPGGQLWEGSVQAAAYAIFQFSDLGNVTPEALASVYENALVPKDVRKALGIHSTPSYLVDYIIEKLRPWIEEIPERERFVFEPACGSAAFLVGAMRLLRELCVETDGEKRHHYLKERLSGIELDPFALEVARLSLTLADIPHANGWNLKQGDIYAPDMLKTHCTKARIILANPPFERFSREERQRYAKGGSRITAATKSMEMLARMVPEMQPGSVLGVVLPLGSLHSKEGRATRKILAEVYEILEICLLPKNAFPYSRHETAIIIARCKANAGNIHTHIQYNRVAPLDIGAFRKSYTVRHSERVQQSAIGQPSEFTLQWRELESVWRYCTTYPLFGDLATVGEGFSFIRKELRPAAADYLRKNGRDGYMATYLGGIAETPIYGQPQEFFCRLDADVVQVFRSGAVPGTPQLLLNHAHLGMPWLIRAVLDPVGHAASNNFMIVRGASEFPLEYFWAILNSPFANAYAHTNRTSRHILPGTIKKMPIPAASLPDIHSVADAAKTYLEKAELADRPMAPAGSHDDVKKALLRMDAEVLRLYDLPPQLERQLLDLFSGAKRLGVGCDFNGYFPAEFKAWIPLHEYISAEHQAAASQDTIVRCEPIKSPATLVAIAATAQLFNEE